MKLLEGNLLGYLRGSNILHSTGYFITLIQGKNLMAYACFYKNRKLEYGCYSWPIMEQRQIGVLEREEICDLLWADLGIDRDHSAFFLSICSDCLCGIERYYPSPDPHGLHIQLNEWLQELTGFITFFIKGQNIKERAEAKVLETIYSLHGPMMELKEEYQIGYNERLFNKISKQFAVMPERARMYLNYAKNIDSCISELERYAWKIQIEEYQQYYNGENNDST